MMDKNAKHISIAMRIGVEFIAGILVGTLIGRAIDIYFETYPWGLVIFIVLGIMAGSLNVYRLLAESWDETGEK
ncbi:MAG: AtpZ/AtpI family protein [Alphaproteobacteria bacterium]|nr:AtpZ/AtpI family protein [Alphaproteobacteria bacterium]